MGIFFFFFFYLRFKDCIYSRMLRINDMYENLLALIIANMPYCLRRHLMNTIELAYRERVRYSDTEAAGGSHVFDSIHFPKGCTFTFS